MVAPANGLATCDPGVIGGVVTGGVVTGGVVTGGVVTGGVVTGGVVTGGVVGGGVVTGGVPPPDTVRPLILGFWVTAVNWITTWPLALAVVLKERAMARLAPPAVAKMSNLDSAAAPLIDTLNDRCPAAVT